MPLRRKTRSTGKSPGAEDADGSPTSNGGRTHPKEMYAPDRATRSRMSSDNLVILELPKNSRKKPFPEAKRGKQSNKTDAKSRKPVDAVSKSSSNNSKQANNVNSSGTSPHLNDSTHGASNRTRRRSDRRSGDAVEKEQKKTSPRTSSDQSVARSERRRRRSENDDELESPGGAENKRHSRRLSSMEDKSPVGKTDTAKETRKSAAANGKKHEQDEEQGNFKVPSISSKIRSSSSDSADVALHDSRRASRRHTPGKSAAIDMVLSMDVNVTSQDALHTRTSPRKPKTSPRPSPRVANKKSAKDSGKASPVTNNAASKDTPPVSPRMRSAAASAPHEEQSNSSAGSDSSRKRRPSGNQTAEAESATHSSRKRRKTGPVCRDLTTEFDGGKSGNSEANDDVDDKVKDDESVGETRSEQDVKDALINSLELSSVQDSDGASSSAKAHRKGTLTPTNCPRKSRIKSPGRSPSRRGLRSSEQAPDAPSGEGDESNDSNSVTEPKGSLHEASSETGEDGARVERTEDSKEDTSEVTNEMRTKDNQGDVMKEVDLDIDEKPIVEELEDFTGEGWYEDVEDTELFFFESDHVALKGNRDYRMMLRTLTTLESQRKQAVQDLDLLVDKKKEALQDPLNFAQKLQQRDDLGLPNPQRVVVLPDIEWSRYLGAAEAIELAGFKHQTRGAKSSSSKYSAAAASKNSNASNINILTAVSQLSQKSTGAVITQSSSSPSLGQQQQASQVSSQRPSTSSTPDSVLITLDRREPLPIVRGRSSDPNKPPSFNQLWTVDEQRKLEELLVKFPMEEVEARRWEKVAKALGNRTPQQVASRVQKYFIKLTKAGLPVPGRIPNLTYHINKKEKGGTSRRIHPLAKSMFQPSTFLQSVRPPVFMDEDEHVGWSGYVPGQDDDDDDDLVSDDESIPVKLRNSEEYRELLHLKKMKKDKLKQQNLMSHQGYKCDGCNMEPIVGIRWHCIDCPAHVSTDLCQACVDCDFSSPDHSSSHHMEPIQYHYGGGPSFVDTDYTTFTPSTGDYNYLDPNYNPSALPT